MSECFKLVSDNDGHWWVVPEDSVEDLLQHIADMEDDVDDPFPLPERAVQVEGGPESIKFYGYKLR